MGITWKGLAKGARKVAKIAAPVAGFALGPAAGLALGAASGLGYGKKSLGKMAKGAALGGLGALAGKAAGVSKSGVLGGLKNLGGSVGKGLSKAGRFTGVIDKDGALDMSKAMGLGLTGAAFKGKRDDNKKASEYNSGNAAMRQALMDRLSKGPDYSALIERISARPKYTF